MKVSMKKILLYTCFVSCCLAMVIISKDALYTLIIESDQSSLSDSYHFAFQQLTTPSKQPPTLSARSITSKQPSKSHKSKTKSKYASKKKNVTRKPAPKVVASEKDKGYNTSGRKEYQRKYSSLRKPVAFDKTPIINRFRFSYPINIEDACGTRKVKVIMPVHSAVTNFERRAMMRRGKLRDFVSDEENNAVLLFFVGMPSGRLAEATAFQQKLDNESKHYQDIVQINTTDIYHNIVNKALGVLHWVLTYCPKSEVVLKLDDDVNINPPRLLLAIYEKLATYTDFIVGELRVNRVPFRTTRRKSYLSVVEYPEDKFPPFVPGPAVGYPTSTASLLYQQAQRTKVVWLDDLFLTGICRDALGIPIFNNTHFQTSIVHRMLNAPNFVYI